MNTDNKPGKGARLQLILVALIFTVPIVAAMWMYFGDNGMRPEGTTNHGAVLDPVVNLRDELLEGPLLAELGDSWALIYLQTGACDDDCREALYKLRQSRLMLGNDMSRVVRVLLHGPEAPDTLFLDTEHAGLATVRDPAARQLLIDMRPPATAVDGYYLVDPLGNLVMYFPLDIVPRDLVDDLGHLLKLPRIG